MIKYYWQHIQLEGPHIASQTTDDLTVFETFLLQGMLLVKDTIKNSSYNTGKLGADLLSVTEEEKELAAEAGRLIHQHLLTTDFVNACAETLVSQYMLLTPQDFNKWEEDPEGWAISLGSENWEFELRPCAEMTFMNLLSQYRDQLVPIMLNLVERVASKFFICNKRARDMKELNIFIISRDRSTKFIIQGRSVRCYWIRRELIVRTP